MSHGALNSFLQDRENILLEITLIDMARQAAAGMKYLGNTLTTPVTNPISEANHVVHRDLALRNLLVTGGGSEGKWIVKVSDLGLSRAVESSYYKSEGKSIPIKWSAPVSS
jgi:serine/threonine protein kinase